MAPEGLPSTVRIGPRDWKIEDWDCYDAAVKNRYGECDYTAKTIRVHWRHGTRKGCETLLHEMLHAIFSEYVIRTGENGDDDERVVTTLAGAMASAWRDNPLVFTVLSDGFSRGTHSFGNGNR